MLRTSKHKAPAGGAEPRCDQIHRDNRHAAEPHRQYFSGAGHLWYEVLVDIGYFTAITMCYFLVEGFRYTHSRKQYALRLFGFGVVSQVPFSMAFAQNGILEFQDFNMMFTLFLCFCILLCIETIRNRFLRGV